MTAKCVGASEAFDLAQQLPQHGAEAVHGADRQAVGGARQRRQRMEGAEDVAGAVDQVDVAALDDGRRLALGHGRRRRLLGFAFGFAHGWVAVMGPDYRRETGPGQPAGSTDMGTKAERVKWARPRRRRHLPGCGRMLYQAPLLHP